MCAYITVFNTQIRKLLKITKSTIKLKNNYIYCSNIQNIRNIITTHVSHVHPDTGHQ